MLFSLAFIVTFLNGGLTGFLGNVTVDVPLSDTYFVVAHFHMVMGIAPILVIFGAIYHWYPLITGRMMNETLGKIHFWITFLDLMQFIFQCITKALLEFQEDTLKFMIVHILNINFAFKQIYYNRSANRRRSSVIVFI